MAHKKTPRNPNGAGRPEKLKGGKSLAIRLGDRDLALIDVWRKRSGRYIPQSTAMREILREHVVLTRL